MPGTEEDAREEVRCALQNLLKASGHKEGTLVSRWALIAEVIDDEGTALARCSDLKTEWEKEALFYQGLHWRDKP